jgi:hypothetical protein
MPTIYDATLVAGIGFKIGDEFRSQEENPD